MNKVKLWLAYVQRHALAVTLVLLATLAAPVCHAQSPAVAAEPVDAWFYLGRQNEASAWAPATRSLRIDSAKDPKRVTVLRDAVLVDNINPDPAGAAGDPAMSEWTRVVRRGPAAIALLELARQDSIGNGKLIWAKVRVPGERVEVTQRR